MTWIDHSVVNEHFDDLVSVVPEMHGTCVRRCSEQVPCEATHITSRVWGHVLPLQEHPIEVSSSCSFEVVGSCRQTRSSFSDGVTHNTLVARDNEYRVRFLAGSLETVDDVQSLQDTFGSQTVNIVNGYDESLPINLHEQCKDPLKLVCHLRSWGQFSHLVRSEKRRLQGRQHVCRCQDPRKTDCQAKEERQRHSEPGGKGVEEMAMEPDSCNCQHQSDPHSHHEEAEPQSTPCRSGALPPRGGCVDRIGAGSCSYLAPWPFPPRPFLRARCAFGALPWPGSRSCEDLGSDKRAVSLANGASHSGQGD